MAIWTNSKIWVDTKEHPMSRYKRTNHKWRNKKTAADRQTFPHKLNMSIISNDIKSGIYIVFDPDITMLDITKFRQLIIKQGSVNPRIYTSLFPEQTVWRKLHRQGGDNRTTQKHSHYRIQRMSVKGVNTIGLLHQVLDPYIHENHKREEHESETPG
jgi:hypothetical protein